MARELTGGELASLRKDGQVCALYLAVHMPVTVLERRLNGVPASDDMVYELTFDDPDGGAGAFGDVVVGQTLYVSASAYGAYDKGMCRIRKAAGAATLYIGEASEIDWTDNDYLTVVKDWDLWPRHLYIDGSMVYMDRDVAYDDKQHEDCDPVPVLGSDAVVWLTGATVEVLFDGSDSWVIDSTIDTYAWSAPGASATADLDTATPTLTYDTASTDPYLVSCIVTAVNGKTFTGYRWVYVFDDANPPCTEFFLRRCEGSWNAGGWSFRVQMHDEALRSEIRDRARVILFAKDWYGGTEESIGPLITGATPIRENIIAAGWVDGESISWDPEEGSVTFVVQGPRFWLDRMQGFPSGIEDHDGAPTTWLEFDDLTVRKGLWHFLHWRTTATAVMDCFLVPDLTLAGGALSTEERQIQVFDAPAGSLWRQITSTAKNTVRAYPCCDRYGRLFVQRDLNELPVADQNAQMVTVMTLATQDWREAIDLERVAVKPVALLDMSGVGYKDTNAYALFSLAPGHIFAWHGTVARIERLALWAVATRQTLANELAALLYAKMNNEYPSIPIKLGANNRAFDICPWQVASLTVAEGDTPRGIAWTKDVTPRRASFAHDPRRGILLADVEFEALTAPGQAQTGDPPAEPPPPPTPPSPPPPPPPPTPPVGYGMIALSQSELGRSMDFFEVEDPHWVDIKNEITGTLYNIALGGSNQLWATSSDGLWYCADAAEATPAWSCIKTDGAAETESSLTGHFQSVDVDGDDVFASWHQDGYPGNVLGGYFTGNAGGVNWVAFSANNIAIHGSARVGYVVDASEGIIACSGCVAGPTTGWLHTIGVGNTNFPDEFSMICVRDGFCMGWESDICEGYVPDGVYDTANYFGIDVLSGAPLYVDDASQELRRATVVLADGNTVFGAGDVVSGRAIYGPQADADSIVWITCAAVSGSSTLIVWSEDGFANFHDKTGDFYAEVDDWAGVSGAGGDGNATVISFEY